MTKKTRAGTRNALRVRIDNLIDAAARSHGR